jgi:hypothetical protein
MRCVLGKPRLGPGTYSLRFEGVREGERGNGKFATPPLVWRFGNGEAIVEIISSSTPVVGNVAGDLLAITTGATVDVAGDTDAAVGQPFTLAIELIGDRRVITITAADGRTVVVGNGGNGE